MKYLKINKQQINNNFFIKKNLIYLKNSTARPIQIKFPFYLDEDLAKLSAMVLDGSLSKKLSSVMFSQKKDEQLVHIFNSIIQDKFNIKGSYYRHKDTDTLRITFSSKTLATFFNRVLDTHKSDEDARIPKWIWNSPRSVIIEYLKYAYSMEGSIYNYLKGSEIKFHSVCLPHIKELKLILKDKFDINSNIQKYYIVNYGWKYYLTFSKQEEIIKFKEIGFAINPHQKRLLQLL